MTTQKIALVITNDGLARLSGESIHLLETDMAVHEQRKNAHLFISDFGEGGGFDDMINDIIDTMEGHEEEYLLYDMNCSKHVQWPDINSIGRYWCNPFSIGYGVHFEYYAPDCTVRFG